MWGRVRKAALTTHRGAVSKHFKHHQFGAMNPAGECRAFDASDNGYARRRRGHRGVKALEPSEMIVTIGGLTLLSQMLLFVPNAQRRLSIKVKSTVQEAVMKPSNATALISVIRVDQR